MTFTQSPSTEHPDLQSSILTFLAEYGKAALLEALQLYREGQQEYICRTRSSLSKIRICDISYLEIQKHQITVHTCYGIFRKYGTLSQELELLAPFGFIKCSQSCIVALNKIRSVNASDLILADGSKVHVSRAFMPKVLTAFNRKQYAQKEDY